VVSPTIASTPPPAEVVWAARVAGTSTITISAGDTFTLRSGGVIVDSAITGGTLSFRNGGNRRSGCLTLGVQYRHDQFISMREMGSPIRHGQRSFSATPRI